jgi:hypothetical protein
MKISKLIDKLKYFNHVEIGYFFSVLLSLSLFRELKSRNYQFIDILSNIGNFALYICISLLIVVFFIFVKKKIIPIILILTHSIIYFLLIFLFEGDILDLDINYIIKRNFQIFILIFVFFIALKTKINLNINKMLKYTFVYIFLLILLSLLDSNSFNLIFTFETISRINAISYFVLTLFVFSLFYTGKPNKLIILISSIIMLIFGSKFFFVFLLILIFFYFLNSLNAKKIYVKSFWFFSIFVMTVFYTLASTEINKVSKIINPPLGKFLKLNYETKIYAHDGDNFKKINILKFEEKIGNTVNSNKKRSLYSIIYNDLYTGLMIRLLLNEFFLDKYLLNQKILLNDNSTIRIESHSIFLDKEKRNEYLTPRPHTIKINYNKIKKYINDIGGIDIFIEMCTLKFPGIDSCVRDITNKSYPYDKRFKNISYFKILDIENIQYGVGYNLDIFSPHNSLLNILINFSFLGMFYIIVSLSAISYLLIKDKIQPKYIMIILYILIIHSAEDYLLSNAFQISILTFFMLGKLFKLEK